MRKWDHYEFKIAGHYLPALINDDYTGLDLSDDCDLTQWQVDMTAKAHADGWHVGHWSCENEEADDWGTCAVSGLFAMRQTVRLMVYKDE